MTEEIEVIERCPECNEESEGTTFLWEVNKTYHQCKNGHMWEEKPNWFVGGMMNFSKITKIKKVSSRGEDSFFNIYKLAIDNDMNYPDYGFFDFIVVAENIEDARNKAYEETKQIAYEDKIWLDRTLSTCKKLGICTDESFSEPTIIASNFTND